MEHTKEVYIRETSTGVVKATVNTGNKLYINLSMKSY